MCACDITSHQIYPKLTPRLAPAYNYLVQNGCPLVLTNADQDVFTQDVIVPGEGALASVLTSIKEPIICGKPETILLDTYLKKSVELSRPRLRGYVRCLTSLP